MVGKELLLTVMNGGRIPDAHADIPTLRRLRRAGRVWRWIAIGFMPCDGPSMTWPGASVFAHFWQCVKTQIVRSAANFMGSVPIGHLSLHINGMRVDRERVDSLGKEVFLGLLRETVLADTQYRADWAIKNHHCFLDLLEVLHRDVRCSIELCQDEEVDPMFIMPGNCIACALWRAGLDLANIKEKFMHPRSEQPDGGGNRFASYRDACSAMGILPGNGLPHGVAVEFARDQTMVYEGDRRFHTHQTAFNALLLDSTDRAGIVRFTRNGPLSGVPVPIGEAYSTSAQGRHLKQHQNKVAASRTVHKLRTLWTWKGHLRHIFSARYMP